MTNRLVLLAIALSPFQTLAVPLAGSRYDLTAFLLLGVAVTSTFRNGKVSVRTIVCLALFVASQLAIFAVLRVAPLPRLISGLVWLGGWLLLGRLGVKVAYDRGNAYGIVLAVLLLSALRIFYEYWFLALERPAAWFEEPSAAGLLLYSASAAIIAVLFNVKLPRSSRMKLLLVLSALMAAAAMTFSMHFITFVISVLLVMTILARPLRMAPSRALVAFVFIAILAVAAPLVLRVSHYADRLNVGAGASNFSTLSWLRGFDQMVGAVAISPVFGMGLGSTGYFAFKSQNSLVLESLDRGNLNLTDAYSLAFRLVIEVGLPLFALGCLYCLGRILDFRAYLRSSHLIPSSESGPQVFLFVFALSLIIGSLIKEPSYARSPIYLGVFFLSSLRLKMAAVARQSGRLSVVDPRVMSTSPC